MAGILGGVDSDRGMRVWWAHQEMGAERKRKKRRKKGKAHSGEACTPRHVERGKGQVHWRVSRKSGGAPSLPLPPSPATRADDSR